MGHEFIGFVAVKYISVVSRWWKFKTFETEILRMRAALDPVDIFGLFIQFPNKGQLYLFTHLSFELKHGYKGGSPMVPDQHYSTIFQGLNSLNCFVTQLIVFFFTTYCTYDSLLSTSYAGYP